MAARVEPNESYFIKEIQAKMAAIIGIYMHDTGGDVAFFGGDPTDLARDNSKVINQYWRKNAMNFYFPPYGLDHTNPKMTVGVYFSKPFYDPQLSDIHYGADKIVQNEEVVNDESTRVFDNSTGKEAVVVSYTEKLTLDNSVEHTISQGMSFDVTVGSETTVSGGYAGVGFEEKISATFGFHDEKSQSQTAAQSKSQETELNIQFTVPAGRQVLLEIKKEQVRIQTPFNIDGILDCSVHLDYQDYGLQTWNHYKYLHGATDFKFEDLNEFQQFFRGYDTDYPGMAGYWEHTYTGMRTYLETLLSPDFRRVQVAGIKDRILQKNATYATTDVTGKAVPDGTKVVHVDGGQSPTIELAAFLPRVREQLAELDLVGI